MGALSGKIVDGEALQQRIDNLATHALNGVHLVFVQLLPAAAPTQAVLDLEFHNTLQLANILAAIGGGAAPHTIFPLSGGSRLRAGSAAGQVRVDQVLAGPAANQLRLRIRPIGDYSTYTLGVEFAQFDPLLAEISFKFRPACFNMNCAEVERPRALPPQPAIDYLAKDFDSFKHTLICAMQQRVPGWQPTSEADLDQVLIDLIAADADELSDFQDRMLNEAFLASARKRVSLARHARLMDYHIHQGNQASTWLAVEASAPTLLPGGIAAGFAAWTGQRWNDAGSRIFVATEALQCEPLLNRLGLYSWGGSVTALEAGSRSADLALPAPLNAANNADALVLRDLLNNGSGRLLIQQQLNPHTGTPNGRDPGARQLLHLLANAQAVFDPFAARWCVRVHWQDSDRLARRYCFIAQCSGVAVSDVSAFHGNLLPLAHGRPHRSILRAPGSPLGVTDPAALLHKDEAWYEPTAAWGVLAELPQAPLAYRRTPADGIAAPRSTLDVHVSGFATPWSEQSDLIESQDDSTHFLVETDEYRRSRLRFGNGSNGRALPEGAVLTCHYQVGSGIDGNVGSDAIRAFDRAANPALVQVWNPFDAVDGAQPEPVAEIVRRVPEAFRARQLRAVTLEDYARRAEELAGVAHARAAYAWTGSWRCVRVAIDPRGSTELDEALRLRIAAHLDAVRLIGEDLEVRPASYVPLDIAIHVCAHPDYWPEHLRRALELEFSDSYTADGRRGLFHADEWTFGQPLHASQLIGRALAVQGVGRVLHVGMRRLHGLSGPSLGTLTLPAGAPLPALQTLEVRSFEIIQVANDPSRLETGRLTLAISGGRR